MTDETLNTRQLNRALLARQLLLERSNLSLTDALQQLAGLQTQYAPSGYIGLWTRLRDFGRSELTRALEERRAVQGTLMRVTIHTISAADYWPMAVALRRARREWWLGVQRRQLESLGWPVDMEAAAETVRRALSDGPMRARELDELLRRLGLPGVVQSGIGLWVDLVRVPPSGTWERRRADLYGLAESWLPRNEIGEDDAKDHLVRRYLAGFGPAPVRDIASWAGLSVAALRPVLERLSPRRFRDERGGELLDLPDAPLPDPRTLAPIRFLPTWDATLLVQARRTQILPEAYRPLVFNVRTPQSLGTFLVNGQVAGTWRYADGRIETSSFTALDSRTRRELAEEAERLAAFHAG